ASFQRGRTRPVRQRTQIPLAELIQPLSPWSEVMSLNQSYAIKAAVGAQPGAMNNSADVEIVQRLLNEHAAQVGYSQLPVNGMVTLQMVEAIRSFQQKVVGMKIPDGRVDPSGATLRKLNEPVGTSTPAFTSPFPDIFAHPNADKVRLNYGIQG